MDWRLPDKEPGKWFVWLGVVAVVFAVFPPDPLWARGAVIMVAFLIARLELRSINTDRVRRDDEARKGSELADERFQATLARIEESRTLAVSTLQVATQLHSAQDTNASKSGLKLRALSLARDVLEFLVERERGEPSFPYEAFTDSNVDLTVRMPPLPSGWHTYTDDTTRYFRETMGLYSERFGSRVRAVRTELATAGLSDEALDRYIESSVNPNVVRRVAERLGALAAQLPAK